MQGPKNTETQDWEWENLGGNAVPQRPQQAPWRALELGQPPELLHIQVEESGLWAPYRPFIEDWKSQGSGMSKAAFVASDQKHSAVNNEWPHS